MLGVTMIVRNEAARLPHLLADLADLADEVVVVDTGSTDATPSICRAWGVTLVEDPWRDDFSYSRNVSIRHATAPFLLFLDGDDRIPEETREKLQWLRDEILPKGGRQAFLLEVRNVDASGGVRNSILQTRVFPRLPGVGFRYAVHEQVANSLQELDVEFVRTDLALEHTGYADGGANRQKAERNAALLRKELERTPGDLHCLLHMAQTLVGLGRPHEAEAYFTKTIAALDPARASGFFVAELYALRAQCRASCAKMLGAKYDLERAAEAHPSWAFPYAVLAEILHGEQRPDEAWQMLQKARAAEWEVGLIGFATGRARFNVELLSGRVLVERGEAASALEFFERALQLDPGNVELRLQLGQLLLDHSEPHGALALLEPAGHMDEAATWLVELISSIGLARAQCGDMEGAGACLAPLLDIFAEDLEGADDVDPMELAGALLKRGYSTAAKNLITLFHSTAMPAA